MTVKKVINSILLLLVLIVSIFIVTGIYYLYNDSFIITTNIKIDNSTILEYKYNFIKYKSKFRIFTM
jgi:hypothetical protein